MRRAMLGHERRKHPRVSFPVLVLFRTDPAQPFLSAYGADLSAGGIRISGLGPSFGDLVDLQLIERDGRRPLEVMGEVVRVEAGEFALRFVELDTQQQSWLTSVIQTRQAEGDLEGTEDLLEASFDEL